MSIWKNILTSAGLGSLLYFGVLWLLSGSDAQFSALPDWAFRIILALVIFFALFRQRLLDRGRMGFLRGLQTAGLTGLLLALGMGLGVYLLQSQLDPGYGKRAEAKYAENRKAQMLAKRLETARRENRTELNEEDRRLVEQGLAKHLEQTAYFFTPAGGMYATWIYASFWVVGISLTGAFLFQTKGKPA